MVLHKHIRHCGSTVNSVVISQLQLYFLLSVSVILVSLDGVSVSQPDGRSVNLPCTIKSRSSFLAPAHLSGPRKRAVKWLCVCVCFSYFISVTITVTVVFSIYKLYEQ